MPSSQEELASSTRRASIDKFILTTSAIALGLRLLIAFLVWQAKPSTWFYSQASELGELAHSFAIGNGLSAPFGGSTGPSAFLPPGYPIFVGLIFKVFGSYSHLSELVILVAQAFFGAAAVLFTMVLAQRLFGRVTSNVTGVILAVHPWLIALSFVFWETSFSLMMLSALVFVSITWRAKPTNVLGYVMAVLGALAIAVNASLALTVIALFAWAAWRQTSARKLLVLPGLLFVALCAVWPMRNDIAMHAFIPLRDNLGYELWQGNRSGADGFFAPELHPNTNQEEFKQLQSSGELRYMARKGMVAKQTILANPGRFVALTVKRILCFWAGISRQTYPNQIAIACLTSLLALIGLLTYRRRRGFASTLPLVLPMLLFPAPYYITHPDFRFWCLLAPFLTAWAVSAFVGSECAADTPTQISS